MRYIKTLAMTVLVAFIAACGGGGGSPGSNPNSGGSGGSGSGSGSGAQTPAAIELIGSGNSLGSTSTSMIITAIVKDSSNNAIANQTISFSATSGVLQGAAAVTDANGVAAVTLATGSNRANRTITVTGSAGSVSANLQVPVTGTSISIAGAGSLLASTGGTYVFRAVDSAGNAVASAVLSVSSNLGNGLSAASVTTDATGQAQIIYTGNNSGTDTLTVSGLGTSAALTIQVSSEDFSVQSPSAGTSIAVSTSQTISVLYRSGGVGVPGQTVTFNTTRGTLNTTTVVTNGSGIAAVQVSSTTSGPATINAQIAGVAQTSVAVEFVAVTPATIVLQANPNAVLPNAGGSSLNQAILLATVRDANANPVKNVVVNFTADSDPSGGSISPANATTDSNGQAQANFVAGATSTPSNGVTLRAAVASNTAIFRTQSMTVSGQALFITIGTGNVIGNLNSTTYEKPFSVYVSDSNNAAVANQSVVLSVYPTIYEKGDMSWNGNRWVLNSMATCANEDLDTDGILDAGEDTNGDGLLTPGGVVVVSSGTVTTDATGFATFTLRYGEQFAYWATTRITARATVAGTESTKSMVYLLEGVASDFTDENTSPAGVFSPFGQSALCTNAQ